MDMRMDFIDILAIQLDIFRSGKEDGANIRLLRVLRLIRGYECEDPRDKVYAALGMAIDGNEDGIISDYTKPASAVYINAIKFCISKPSNQCLNLRGETFQVTSYPLEKVLDSCAYGASDYAYNPRRRNIENGPELSRGLAFNWELANRDDSNMSAEGHQMQSWMLEDAKVMTFGRRMFETSRGFTGSRRSR
ncbi:hypothetical protein COCMIDRAFT_28454 [Bipolaris oryzae ATCC 44560]|uniref:Uncharacterized protein n=1 Tax=Bipolaris oryzae ATCC 44560 TaxID=930090 RepID=W6ZHI7_COCMI|nr:uncharacterized protein COCMIDRAFT_28454 [Bipolaris oryzae ATCC 44560]EUC43016.1 hypothetical protein COCMIDRAFT_28454 [Bipolaris oryzae ATCC 44560]